MANVTRHHHWFLCFSIPPSRGPGDVIGDCKVQFLEEIYQVEKPGARALSAADGQFKRTHLIANPPHSEGRACLRCMCACGYESSLLQGRAAPSVSTARRTQTQSVASAPAACAAASRMLTCSCCVMSATWRFTSTASTRHWPPSQMTKTGERGIRAESRSRFKKVH